MTDLQAAAGAGRSFVETLAAKRWDDLVAVVDPHVAFKGITPGRFWEASTAGELIDDVLQRWFEPNDHIEALDDMQVGAVTDRSSLRYRLRVRTTTGSIWSSSRATTTSARRGASPGCK